MTSFPINLLLLLPSFFLIGFLFNLLVIWIILMFDKFKIKKSKLLISTFIYTIVIMITEFILFLVTATIFGDVFFWLYGIFPFVGIFIIFKMLMPRLMELNKEKVNKYALIMSTVTVFALIVLHILSNII